MPVVRQSSQQVELNLEEREEHHLCPYLLCVVSFPAGLYTRVFDCAKPNLFSKRHTRSISSKSNCEQPNGARKSITQKKKENASHAVSFLSFSFSNFMLCHI